MSRVATGDRSAPALVVRIPTSVRWRGRGTTARGPGHGQDTPRLGGIAPGGLRRDGEPGTPRPLAVGRTEPFDLQFTNRQTGRSADGTLLSMGSSKPRLPGASLEMSGVGVVARANWGSSPSLHEPAAGRPGS